MAAKVGRHPGPCVKGHEGPLTVWSGDGGRQWASCSFKEWDGSYCNGAPLNPDPTILQSPAAASPPPPAAAPPPQARPPSGPDAAGVGAALTRGLEQLADAVLTAAGQVADAIARRGGPPVAPERAREARSDANGAGVVVDAQGRPVRTEAGLQPTAPERVEEILGQLRGGQ